MNLRNKWIHGNLSKKGYNGKRNHRVSYLII